MQEIHIQNCKWKQSLQRIVLGTEENSGFFVRDFFDGFLRLIRRFTASVIVAFFYLIVPMSQKQSMINSHTKTDFDEI